MLAHISTTVLPENQTDWAIVAHLVSCSFFFFFATLYSYCLLPEGSLDHPVDLVFVEKLDCNDLEVAYNRSDTQTISTVFDSFRFILK